MITDKTWKTIVFAIIIAVILEFMILSYQASVRNQISKETPLPTHTATATPKPGGSAKTNAKLYTDLVVQYTGRRIQFDINCQAIPNNITYKNGTNIMLDNRSGDARTISVGGIKYYLAGYGYQVITLYSQNLPKNLLLNCGAAVNVGQILLQK